LHAHSRITKAVAAMDSFLSLLTVISMAQLGVWVSQTIIYCQGEGKNAPLSASALAMRMELWIS